MLTDKEIIAGELQVLADKISQNLDSTGTTASGKSKKSLRVEITDFSVILYARPFFQSVEQGRSSGKVPKGFNEIIKDWIKNKGVSFKLVPYKRQPSQNWRPKYTVEERSLNLAAGAISHSIKVNGTKLFQQGGRSDIYTNEFKKSLGIIKKKVSLEIIKSITQTSK